MYRAAFLIQQARGRRFPLLHNRLYKMLNRCWDRNNCKNACFSFMYQTYVSSERFICSGAQCMQTKSGLRSAGLPPLLRHDWSGMLGRPHPFSPWTTGLSPSGCSHITGVHTAPLLSQTSVLLKPWDYLAALFSPLHLLLRRWWWWWWLFHICSSWFSQYDVVYLEGIKPPVWCTSLTCERFLSSCRSQLLLRGGGT